MSGEYMYILPYSSLYCVCTLKCKVQRCVRTDDVISAAVSNNLIQREGV